MRDHTGGIWEIQDHPLSTFGSFFKGLRCLRHFGLHTSLAAHLFCTAAFPSVPRAAARLLRASQVPWEFLSDLGISSAPSFSFGPGASVSEGFPGTGRAGDMRA